GYGIGEHAVDKFGGNKAQVEGDPHGERGPKTCRTMHMSSAVKVGIAAFGHVPVTVGLVCGHWGSMRTPVIDGIAVAPTQRLISIAPTPVAGPQHIETESIPRVSPAATSCQAYAAHQVRGTRWPRCRRSAASARGYSGSSCSPTLPASCR